MPLKYGIAPSLYLFLPVLVDQACSNLLDRYVAQPPDCSTSLISSQLVSFQERLVQACSSLVFEVGHGCVHLPLPSWTFTLTKHQSSRQRRAWYSMALETGGAEDHSANRCSLGKVKQMGLVSASPGSLGLSFDVISPFGRSNKIALSTSNYLLCSGIFSDTKHSYSGNCSTQFISTGRQEMSLNKQTNKKVLIFFLMSESFIKIQCKSFLSQISKLTVKMLSQKQRVCAFQFDIENMYLKNIQQVIDILHTSVTTVFMPLLKLLKMV